MSTILSAGTRNSLSALQDISSLMRRSQTRLATGKRVNSPIDNPINFFTASALNSRAAQLGSLVDAASNGLKAIETAAHGIAAIQSLVTTAQSIANQALQSPESRASVTGSVSGLTGASAITINAGDTITVSDGTTTATYTADGSATVQEFLDAVNNTANLNVTASLTSDGKIELKAESTNSIVIGGTSDAAEKLSIGLTAGTTASPINTTRQALATQFDQIRTQIDQLAKDAGYNGVNLLNGDSLSFTFNENGTSKLTVTGVTDNSSTLGIPVASTGSGQLFQNNTEITAALTALSSGLSTLSSQSQSLQSHIAVVSNRQDFNSDLAALLESGADDLVLADPNEESATLLALKTRRDLAVTALSLTAESDRAVLRLFSN